MSDSAPASPSPTDSHSSATQAPVMVTGATGYVAGWIIKKLLEGGHTVHATVRDPGNEDKLKYLNELAANSTGDIVYFKADLLDEKAFDAPMQGCEIVMHTASPFTVNVEDPQRDLVDPAVKGTRFVLEAVNRCETVQRVVLTSSCVAILGDAADLATTRNGEFTEEEWNTTSSLTHQPYSYSKVMAEKEAWKIHDAQVAQRDQKRWDLVTINPSFVIGPGINPHGTSETFNTIIQFGDGTMKAGVPRYGMAAVDVREVAQAHLEAAFRPEAQGRYILSAQDSNFYEMVQLLREKFGDDYPLSSKALPKWIVWLVGPMINKALTRKVISRNVDLPWKTNNSKSINELGIQYRPIKESLQELFQQLIDSGRLKPQSS